MSSSETCREEAPEVGQRPTAKTHGEALGEGAPEVGQGPVQRPRPEKPQRGVQQGAGAGPPMLRDRASAVRGPHTKKSR